MRKKNKCCGGKECFGNRWGLILGLFMVIVHFIWVLAVAISQNGMQKFINWISGLHHLQMPLTIMPFNLGKAVLLVVFAFVVGYIVGLILGCLYCWLKKCD